MTPAVKLLERSGITHRVLTYDHDPTGESFGLEAAEALDLDPSVVFKTLIAGLDGTRPGHAVAIVPVDTRLDLKALAAAVGAKKAAMADGYDAERLTGYVVGGISPLGQRKQLPTVLDTSAEALPLIYVSGGRRGLDIEVAPSDLLTLVDGRYAPIAVSKTGAA